jgi:glutamine cyclotransferase
MKETYNSGIFNSSIFLEGSIYFKEKIYLLTYKESIVFIYEIDNLDSFTTKTWDHGEGWGMTHNDTHIFISNGSNLIFIAD